MWFSNLLRLPVGVYIRILVQLIHMYVYIYMYITAYCFFLSFLKAVSSFASSLSFPHASVLYTYFHVCIGMAYHSTD